MATSNECNDAWTRGYLNGYAHFRNTIPTVPPCPALPTTDEDPLEYFYKLGNARGREDSIQIAAGIGKSE